MDIYVDNLVGELMKMICAVFSKSTVGWDL
jgi:hypothetical protein